MTLKMTSADMNMNVLVVLAVFIFQTCYGGLTSPADVVNYARTQIGSTKWLDSGTYIIKPGKDKCHLFVGDVLQVNGARNSYWFVWEMKEQSLISNNYVEAPDAPKFRIDWCWEICQRRPQPGDVIASGGHVGIATGENTTIHASFEATPLGLIVENSWGFRPGQSVICWKYVNEFLFC